MIGFIEMLLGTRYLGSLLTLTNFIQVQHTNNSPNNSNFVVSKHGTYFVKFWALAFMRWNVCDLTITFHKPQIHILENILIYLYINDMFYFKF
jgi:hypothetical protein